MTGRIRIRIEGDGLSLRDFLTTPLSYVLEMVADAGVADSEQPVPDGKTTEETEQPAFFRAPTKDEA